MPKHPGHGDPRHYETDITKLKTTIADLGTECQKLQKERDAANQQVIKLLQDLAAADEHHQLHHQLRHGG